MAIVRAEKKQVREHINELINIVEREGGYLHKALIIECLQDNMLLKLKRPLNNGEVVIKVPEDCIPVIQDFDIRFDGVKVSGEPLCNVPHHATQNQQKIMSLMLELYNETDKVNQYAQFSPLVALIDYEQLILLLKSSFTTANKLFDFSGDLNQLKLEAFLESRCYEDFLVGRFRLMPIIDFADHHVLAKSFLNESENGRISNLGIVYSKIEKREKSILVCYRQKDRLASFINYGFVDRSVKFVQSIPVDVELPGGNRLSYGAGYIDDNMMEESKQRIALPGFQFSKPHFSAYVANMRAANKKALEIHYCIVPRGRELPAFREVIKYQLRYFEERFGLNVGEVSTFENVLAVERSIIVKNLAYYHQLKSHLGGISCQKAKVAAGMLGEVIQYQLAHLENYAEKAGVELGSV